MPLPGERIAGALAGPRTCTGVWTGTARRPCPARSRIPADTTDPQCPACARADPGTADRPRRGARRRRPRVPAVPRLVRPRPGQDRAHRRRPGPGPPPGTRARSRSPCSPPARTPPIRQAERLDLSRRAGRRAHHRAGQGRRLASRLPPPGERAALLTAARDQVTSGVPWPERVRLLPGGITDQAGDFGLDGAARRRSRRSPASATALSWPARSGLVGRPAPAPGHPGWPAPVRHAPHGRLGRPFSPRHRASPRRARARRRPAPGGHDDGQQPLF